MAITGGGLGDESVESLVLTASASAPQWFCQKKTIMNVEVQLSPGSCCTG